MRHARVRQSGIALMMALLLSVFVVVISLTLIAWVQYDNGFAARGALEMRAFYLAQSGMDYYRIHGAPTPGFVPLNAASPNGDGFTITITPAGTMSPAVSLGDIRSTGRVVRGNTIATRTLVCPAGQFPDVRDEGTND